MGRAALIAAVAFLCGCSAMVKTPVVANYSNLERIDRSTTKNDVALLLGAPQGSGTHVLKNTGNELQFYYGFAGKFTMSSAQYDSGTAFISYKSDKPVDVTYFTSKASGREIKFSKNLSIKAIADRIVLGASKVDAVFQAIGPAEYTGRRLNFENGIDHQVAFWDASEIQTSGAINEKWLLIGYDGARTVQDLVWVSSRPEDIKDFGSVTEQQMRQLSRMTFAGFLPVLEATAMSSSTKIDPVQVDALIRTQPKNIKSVINVLGLPSALGIKSFAGDQPMSLSNWSFSITEMKGEEYNYVPPYASEQEKLNLVGAPYLILNVEQSRLMVGHAAGGEIKEIIWVKPIKQ